MERENGENGEREREKWKENEEREITERIEIENGETGREREWRG